MGRNLIQLILVLLTAVVVLIFEPKLAQAFSMGGILKDVGQTAKSSKIPSVGIPFGGKITESSTACKLHYWMTEPPFFIPHPGVPIPLFGTKIKVGPPGIPASDIFTFPGITKIYANKNENRVGVWTLGITSNTNFMKSLINKANSSISKLPPIVVGPVSFFKFSLSCPDGGIILKIGTSGKN